MRGGGITNASAAARRVESIGPASRSVLDELSPLLDEGIANLGEADRRGVLMCFFDNQYISRGRPCAWSFRRRCAQAPSRGRSANCGTSSHPAASRSIRPRSPVKSSGSTQQRRAGDVGLKRVERCGNEQLHRDRERNRDDHDVDQGEVRCGGDRDQHCQWNYGDAVALTDSGPNDAQAAPATGRASPQAAARAEFADGVAIELLGVAHSSDGRWYTGNGTPTDEQCDPNDQMSPTSHQVCFRIDKLPEGSSVVWKTTANMWSTKPASKAGANAPGLFVIGCEQRRKPTLDVTCKIATAEWETLASCKAAGTMCHPYDQGSVAFAPMYEQDGGTCASIAHDIADHQVRVQAIDGDGIAHPAEVRVINSPGKLVQMNLFFPLPIDKIDKVELQVRPYDHVATFTGISLEAGQRSDVSVIAEKN